MPPLTKKAAAAKKREADRKIILQFDKDKIEEAVKHFNQVWKDPVSTSNRSELVQKFRRAIFKLFPPFFNCLIDIFAVTLLASSVMPLECLKSILKLMPSSKIRWRASG
jgi:hypothetical protein